MIDITFLPNDDAPRYMRNITYHMDEWNKDIAEEKATVLFKKEHSSKTRKHYKMIAISETRVI